MNHEPLPLDRARELVPDILATADEIDRLRMLPVALSNKMADAGMFRLLMARELSGAEMDFPTYLSVIQTLAEADGSTAWCANQAAVFAAVYTRMLPAQLAEEIWGDQRAAVANGPPSQAEAIAVAGGYQFSGSWHFSSGGRHATWICAVARLKTDAQGVDVQNKRPGTII